ncbi:uncharacterized protein KGF55_003938 [Candida pseudojiufengensis]|uniref:uncharacterized protein n=1 Tax=Candida pseudojiufengensis TaxID=497109 RepID=UPI0022256325|nr:uncharacterized protein KGF55_003938 [Candida pseudojiufengensis]KAI5961621.1 hypothetical protein KGF55_003938 [Candida pseudojiufengensis]
MSTSSDTSISTLCCFCLGDDTEIPSFGTLKDAKDMLKPCTTCSLICHRKCLLDWFNSIPSDQLHIIHANKAINLNSISRNNHDHIGDIGIGSPPNNNQTTNIRINLSTQALESWFNGITRPNTNEENHDRPSSEDGTENEESPSNEGPSSPENPHQHHHHQNYQPQSSKSSSVYIFAPCPQCKKDIIFRMKRSLLLSSSSHFKSFISKLIKYGGIFLGITSAITGILSMGYIGLTTTGLKMMENIIPSTLLVRMLTKKRLITNTSYSSLSKILFGNSSNYAVDNLEQALIQGLIDPLKFSRIPVLPIVMYRLRSSSIIKLIFGIKNDEFLSSLITEFMISGYISSIADHSLIRLIYKNLRSNLQRGLIFSNPLNGINFLTNNNIVSLIIPLRWSYDLIYRLTFNRAYFNLTMKSRPRAIANSLNNGDEIDELEDLNCQLNGYKQSYQRIYQKIEIKINNSKSLNNIPLISNLIKYIYKNILYFKTISQKNFINYISLIIKINFKYTIACLKFDYSNILINQNTIFKCLTTILWPYFASKLGNLFILPLLNKNSILSNLVLEKKLLISNILGLVFVCIIKEIINLYLSNKKVKQILNIETIDLKENSILNNFAKKILNLRSTQDEEDLLNYINDEISTDEFESFLQQNQDENNFIDIPGNYPS